MQHSNSRRNRIISNRRPILRYAALEARNLLACINVGGEITVDTVWDSAVDEYCLTEGITIKNGAILTILNTNVSGESTQRDTIEIEQGELRVNGSWFESVDEIAVYAGGLLLADGLEWDSSAPILNVPGGHIEFTNSNVLATSSGTVGLEAGATGFFRDNRIESDINFAADVDLSDVEFTNNILNRDLALPAHSVHAFLENNDVSSRLEISISGDITADLSLLNSGMGRVYKLDSTLIAPSATLRADNVALRITGNTQVAGSIDANGVFMRIGNSSLLQVLDGGSVQIGNHSAFETGTVDVLQGGTLSIADSSLRVGSMQVSGTIDITGSDIASWSMELRDGSTGNINNNSISSRLTIDGNAQVTLADNSITTTHVELTGDADHTVDLANNFWNTTNLDEIAERITDQMDDSMLPAAIFQPILTQSNLVKSVTGTEADDRIVLKLDKAAGTFSIEFNQITSRFSSLSLLTRINLNGLGGDDALILELTNSDDIAELFPTGANVDFGNLPITAESFEAIVVQSSDGEDSAVFRDSPGDDQFTTSFGFEMRGPGFQNRTSGFKNFRALSTEGFDEADISTQIVGEQVVFRDGNMAMVFEDNQRFASGFNYYTAADNSGGSNRIVLWGTTGDDFFARGDDGSVLQTPDLLVETRFFNKVTAHGNGGHDVARLSDTILNDTLFARFGEVYLSNEDGQRANALDFDHVTVISAEGVGNDKATFVGTDQSERYVGNGVFSELKNEEGFFLRAYHFANVTALSGGGNDTAFFYDTEDVDTFVGTQNYNAMFNSNFRVAAIGFPEVTAISQSGSDIAHLSDSTDNDIFLATPTFARMTSDNVSHLALGFGQVFANSTAGMDQAIFRDGAGDDVFVSKPTSAMMSGDGYQNLAVRFASSFASSTLGDDIARFVDSAGADTLFMDTQGTRLKGDGFNNFATGFRRNLVFSVGGHDLAYLSDTEENDFLGGKDNGLWMFNPDYYRFVHGFETVQATAFNGGVNRTNLDVAFELDLFGDWL